VLGFAGRTALALAGASIALWAGAAGADESQPPPAPAFAAALSRWTFRLDSSNRGLASGWRSGAFGGASVKLPSVVDPGEYKGVAGMRNYEGSIAWYRTAFDAPAAGTYAIAFQSANFRATVWIDGRQAAVHNGSYLPFEARAALAAGRHTVVVRADWRDPAMQSRLGFHRTWFNWGGINGGVEVRELGESELGGASLQTSLTQAGARVRVGVRVRNDGPARVLAVQGTLSRGGQAVALAFAPLELQHGQSAEASATATVPDPSLWSPSHPSLYQLSLAVGRESSLSARVGLRQLRWSGGRLYLNGHPLRLHGASLQEDALGHGDALTPADDVRLVAELKAIGANAVRSQHPLSPALLERLDAAGLLVWQGIGPVEGAGNWYSSTPALVRAAEQQARTAAEAAALHPAIVAWNLVDEVAGNGRNAAEVRYVTDLTAWLHANDPGRLVAVDVWGDHPPSRAGALYRDVDAVAETDYTGWYDSPLATPAQQAAQIGARLRTMRATFPGKMLVVSEFGAEANSLNPPGAPGSYSYQAALLARHISIYAADPDLSGMLIWDLRDYPLIPAFEGGSIHFRLPHLRLIEGMIQKGLFTYAGSPKPAVATVARLFGSLPRG
jgi:hypothetical protein